MSSYAAFAQYYDELTGNVEYGRRAEYLLHLCKHLHHDMGLTLDLACGTGSLTLELFRRGVDIYGIDASVDMLSVAREKCMDAGADILFLCQKMQELDLYGTVDTVICSLDSINHLENETEVEKAFKKVSFFMNPGGLFLFDINTPYKHEHILGNNTFVYDMKNVYCVWQNRYHSATKAVDIRLDFFERDGDVYYRSSEHFRERAYEIEHILSMLHQAGFGTVDMFEEMTLEAPGDTCQRIVVAAKKG